MSMLIAHTDARWKKCIFLYESWMWIIAEMLNYSLDSCYCHQWYNAAHFTQHTGMSAKQYMQHADKLFLLYTR